MSLKVTFATKLFFVIKYKKPAKNHPTKFLSPPHLPRPTKIDSPSTKQQFSSYNSIKAEFLAVVIAPAAFLFYFHTLWAHRSC